MKSKFKLLITLLSVLSLTFVAVAALAFASDSGEKGEIAFSDEIVALTPKGGEEISVVNEYIQALYSRYNGKYSSITGLFNTTDEMSSFISVLADADAVRELYKKWDDFKPVNNVLSWETALEAEDYEIVLSRSADLSTCVYKTVTSEKEILLDNILYPGETYFWQVKANCGESGSVYSEVFEFSTKASIRTVDIDGVSNTRDIGGLDTPYGKTLNGLVYRGARLDDITEKGIAQMDALGIKSDVDLRNLNEGKRNPSNRENDYAYLSAPMYLQGFDAIDADGYKASLRNIISIFADENNYPLYFHCSVGRDRTGTLSFLLNTLLGADERDVILDYLTSLFSVTGSLSVSKDSDDLFQAITAVYIMLDAYEGDSYAEKTADYLLSIGVTQEEIDKIRDIFTGKIEVLQGDSENASGYGDKAIVSFECFGKSERTFAYEIGEIISAPYELEDGYVWTLNGVVADFSVGISGNARFVAKKTDGFIVTTIVSGSKTEKFYQTGAAVDLSQFEKAGYNCYILDENGDILRTLKVERDITLSIIYIKK